jgi:hypothetical protein
MARYRDLQVKNSIFSDNNSNKQSIAENKAGGLTGSELSTLERNAIGEPVNRLSAARSSRYLRNQVTTPAEALGFGDDFSTEENGSDTTGHARIVGLKLSAQLINYGNDDSRFWLRKTEIARSAVQAVSLFNTSNQGHALQAIALDANTDLNNFASTDYFFSQSATAKDVGLEEWGSVSNHAIRCMCAGCARTGFDTGGPVGNNPLAKDLWDLEQIVFNMMGPNRKWGSNTVTFGFYEDTFLPTYGTEGTNGFVAFNAGQRNFARQALRTWADVAGLNFVEAAPGTAGDIMFGNTNTGSASQAYAYYPFAGSTGTANGDVWMNSTIASNFDPQLGNYPYLAFIHELGHALGVSHPGPYNAAPGVSITYDNNALYRQDTNMYTVMSYFSSSVTGANWTRPDTGQYVHAQTPMIHDIAVMQRIYGTNLTTRRNNTTYGFNASSEITGAALVGGMNPNRVYDFTQNAFPVIAIWDAGGLDTIDLSGFTRSNVLDLAWGAYSNVNGMVNNLSIAYGATIEVGIGGSNGDTIYGNQANNRLEGRGGNDILDGRSGNDILIGGDGADTLIGGTGIDVAYVRGIRSQFSISTIAGSTSRLFTNLLAPTDSDTISADVERILYSSDVNTILPRDFNGDFMSETISRAMSGSSQLWTFDNNSSSTGYNQVSFRNAATLANYRMVV